MIAASALLTADEATPQLAAAAVRMAMERAGIAQAGEVVLFLTPEFARLAGPAVTAASHIAGCLQVFGSVVAGVASNEGWAMDRPAAAALVIGEMPRTTSPGGPAGTPRVSLCGRLHLPAEWNLGDLVVPRVGLVYSDSLSTATTPVWQGARIAPADHAELSIAGCRMDLSVSTGVAIGTGRLRVEHGSAHEIVRVATLPGGTLESASASLRRVLPVALRDQRALPIHVASAAIASRDLATPRLVPLVSANSDGSITLAEPLPAGTEFSWALRLPATAEADMQRTQDDLAAQVDKCVGRPAFGLFFSCIGRGPFFYAGEDRDLAIMQKACPGLPFVGAYGSGQIVPSGDRCELVQNTVVSVLFTPLAPTA
jgi:hypothetical protein